METYGLASELSSGMETEPAPKEGNQEGDMAVLMASPHLGSQGADP